LLLFVACIRRRLFVAVFNQTEKTCGFAEQTIAGTAVDSASLGLERIGASPLLLRNQR
jgi:hypothetical protein